MRYATRRWAVVAAMALMLGLDASVLRPSGTAESFYDEFGGGLDPEKWLIVEKNWGGQVNGEDYNGGVVRDNVEIAGGKLVFRAMGNRYVGPLRGINRDGSRRSDGRRVGAAIATKRYFGSGRYEVCMKIIPRTGVASAMWLFYYNERPDGKIENHEIDIEFPGRATEEAAPSFGYALMNTWVGETDREHTVRYQRLLHAMDDGGFHVYRFDWRSGNAEEQPRVDFFVDGEIQSVITTNVPNRAGRLYIGAWFPRRWAGNPDFESDSLEVAWVRIMPFPGMRDEFVPEKNPHFGLVRVPLERPSGHGRSRGE